MSESTKKKAACPACNHEWNVDLRGIKSRVLVCPNCKHVDFIEYYINREKTLKQAKHVARVSVYQEKEVQKSGGITTDYKIPAIKKKKAPKPKDHPFSLTSDCFIVTATYGTDSYDSIGAFYRFRNEFLLKRKWGILFTKAYYKTSPPFAAVIRRSGTLRHISRFFLDRARIFLDTHLK